MQDFEKLGAFYLGRRVEQASGQSTQDLVLYDAKDLTTHAVVIGMTGSGKTGLGIGLIEEAALDHVPVIAIDPKGDLGNLLLSFPRLRPEDFEPWVDPRKAAEKGKTAAELASETASIWREGLADWGQTPARIAALHQAVDMALYTPGSSAGLPLSVLREFRPPPTARAADRDLYRDRLQSTVTGLLTLIGVDADPISSPEHILLSTVLDSAWQQGVALDLGGLIAAVQHPVVQRIGVMELDSFLPPKQRFALAMRLNNLLAAPGFQAWMEGETLDIDRLLFGAGGKPRVSVMSIAHLGEAERMFFVTLLLSELVAWMRRQPGSGSLRAILYMDEVFGYMPPVANPPAKQLLLTLLKQARAYGVGLVLATQNPVDLDYKGLSNAGTWFIGRLQTERDRARVRDGLLGAAGSGQVDAGTLDATLSGLDKRRFLLHNVHEREPVLFETRWVMSYLAGPLTREQIGKLSGKQRGKPDPAPPSAAAPAAAKPQSEASARPVLAPDIPQYFAAAAQPTSEGATLVYYPCLLATGTLGYQNARLDLSTQRPFSFSLEPDEESGSADWAANMPLTLAPTDLRRKPRSGASYAELPACLGQPKQYARWQRELKRWLRSECPLTLYKSGVLKQTSRPDETERDFRIRLQQLGNERRDLEVAKLRERYEKQVARLEDRLRRAEQALETQAEQAQGQKLDTALSFGTAVLGALLGRKRISVGSASRVGTALRKASRISKETGDVRRAEATLAAVQAKLVDLRQKFDEDVAELDAVYDAQTEELEQIAVKPRAAEIEIKLLGLGWFPYLDRGDGPPVPAWKGSANAG